MNNSSTTHKLEAIIVNQLSSLEAVVVTVLTNAVAVVGGVGNLLTIIILRSHGLNNSTNIVLLSLAVADFLFLVTSWTRNVSVYIRYFDKALAVTMETYVFNYAMVFNSMFLVISTTHIVIIAIERVVAVFCPLQVSRWFSHKRMGVIAAAAHVLWYPVWAPLFFITEVVWSTDRTLNRTVAQPAYTDFHKSHAAAFDAFYKYFMMMFVGPGYSGVVLCCCVAIGVKLRAVTNKRLKMVTGQEKANAARDGVHLKAVRMLVVVCLVYLCGSLPATLFHITDVATTDVYIDEVKSFSTVFLWCLNCSADFFIYVAMSVKFKNTFKQLCFCNTKSC